MKANHCEDCVHFLIEPGAGEGYCPEAAEALALEGWPKVTVSIAPEMSAESCPSFEDKRAAYGPDEAAEDAYRAKRDDELCEALACQKDAA